MLRSLLDYWFVVPLAGAAVVAYRFLGWRGLLAVVTLGLASGLYTKGRTDQRAKMEQDAQRARSKAIEVRSDVDAEVTKDGPDAARDYLRSRLPDDPR